MRWTYFLALAFPACTSLTFQSSGQIPLFVSIREKHETPVEARGIKQFYLWGLIGPDSTINIDQELRDLGVDSAASLRVASEPSFESLWKSWFSLGFYLPRPWHITAFSNQSEQKSFLERKFFQEDEN